jgi:hypothetical protein
VRNGRSSLSCYPFSTCLGGFTPEFSDTPQLGDRRLTLLDSLRCNKFLEPTSYCNGEMVKYGVLHLHARGLAFGEGRADPEARYARIFTNTQLPRGDTRNIIWRVIGSAMALGGLFFEPPRPVSQQVRVVDAPVHVVTRRHPESRHSQNQAQSPNTRGHQRQHRDSQRPSLPLDLRGPPRSQPSSVRRSDLPPWEDEHHVDRHLASAINERPQPSASLGPGHSAYQQSPRPPAADPASSDTNHGSQQWHGNWDIASGSRQQFPSSPRSVAPSARASRPPVSCVNVDNPPRGPGLRQGRCTCRGCEGRENTILCDAALENYRRQAISHYR